MIWDEYWKNNNYVTRLNPEIKVLWRDVRQHAFNCHDPNIYIKMGQPYKMKNRYIEPQYTLVSTFTLNANKRRYETSYKNLDDKINYIDNIFNKKLCPLEYAIGIDEGTKDLASITLVKKAEGNIIPQGFKIIRLKKAVYDFDNKDIKVIIPKTNEEVNIYDFSLPYVNKKDNTVRQFHVLQNPSYYLNQSLFKKVFPKYDFDEIKQLLFEEDCVVSLDLTTAKIISGYIVEYGDFRTNQKLKVLHAKRRIIETLQLVKQKEEDNVYPSWDDNNFSNFKIKLNNEVIYRHAKIYDSIQRYDDVVSEIDSFYKEAIEEYKKSNYAFSMDSVANLDAINKTRCVMVGNMIGVLKKIYDTYPCYFVFEDFSSSDIESKKIKNEGDIFRPLERALYSKFQEEGMTPVVNEIIRLKDEDAQKSIVDNNAKLKVLKQIGIIKYVDKEKTSSECPCCGQSVDKRYYKFDKERELYVCGNNDCRFVNHKPEISDNSYTSDICPMCGNEAYCNEESKINEKELDSERGIFYCKHCHFLHIDGYKIEDVKKFKSFFSLDTNDKIAAFNIAKRSFKEN